MTSAQEKNASAWERDAEQGREQLAETLDELRLAVSHNLSTAGLVDRIAEYARGSGGADFIRNLGQQVRDNPLPVTLVGAGVAWLALSSKSRNGHKRDSRWNGSGTAHAADHNATDKVSELRDRAAGSAEQLSDAVSSAAHRWGSRLKQAGATLSSTAGNMRDKTGQYGSGVGDSIAALSNQTRDAGRRGRSLGQSTAQTVVSAFRDNPALWGVVGVVLGTALAAALPVSEAEAEAAEKASTDIKDAAKGFAEEQYDHMREAVADVSEGTMAREPQSHAVQPDTGPSAEPAADEHQAAMDRTSGL